MDSPIVGFSLCFSLSSANFGSSAWAFYLGPIGEVVTVAINTLKHIKRFLKKGKLFKDKEIKDFLAKDYKKYNKQIIDLEKKILSEDEKPNFLSEDLRKR